MYKTRSTDKNQRSGLGLISEDTPQCICLPLAQSHLTTPANCNHNFHNRPNTCLRLCVLWCVGYGIGRRAVLERYFSGKYDIVDSIRNGLHAPTIDPSFGSVYINH